MSVNLKKNLKEFGLVFGIGLPLIIGFLLPLLFGHNYRLWTLFVGIIFLLLSIVSPLALKIPYKIWMQLGNILGWINSKIILTIVYILVLIPISIIMKFIGYDPLNLKNVKSQSYKKRVEYNINLNRIF